MELLIRFEKYDDKINGDGLSQEDIEQIIKELEFDGEVKISEKNIGPGADRFVILAAILAFANIFLLGDKIDKGIEGWINIGKRIKGLFSKDELVSVDKDGATLLAIELVAASESIEIIEKISELEIPLVDFTPPHLFGDGRTSKDLISKPYCYHVFSFLINNEKMFVVGVKSSGETNLIKCFDAVYGYGIKEIKKS